MTDEHPGDCDQCAGAVLVGRRCDICNQEMRKADHTHHLEVSPIFPDRCLGCWLASLELEKFLVRAADETHMGDWAAGWLREIIKGPWRYL